ncbi:MAG: DUF3578 domain-containing protein [Emcibacteraceae bacterium]|nr:DUF3578 domain-containing protein [Emcibacteraceae bacterium]
MDIQLVEEENMRETILKIANLWPAYYKGVTEDKDHEAYKLLIHELPLAISALNEQYKFLTTGSSGGAGNITRGPWAATYDTRITSKPTEGYYVVFLFSVVKINLNMKGFLLKEKEPAKVLKKFYLQMNLLDKYILVNLRTVVLTVRGL